MRRAALILGVCALALTGCAPSPTVVDGDHRLIVATSRPGAMAGVGFGGVLGVDDAGCIVLGRDSVLLAPPGSTLKGNKLTLNYGAGQTTTLALGQSTDQLGGDEVGPGSQYVPPGTKCSSTKFLLLG